MDPPWSVLSAGTFSAPQQQQQHSSTHTHTSSSSDINNNKHFLSCPVVDVNNVNVIGDSSTTGNSISKSLMSSSGSASANKIPRVQNKEDAEKEKKKTKNDSPVDPMSPKRKKADKSSPVPSNSEMKDAKEVETKHLKDVDKPKPYDPDEVRSYMEKQKRARKLKEIEEFQNRQKEIEMKKKHLEELNQKTRKLRLRTSSINSKPAASEGKHKNEILEAANDLQKVRKKQLNFPAVAAKVRNLSSSSSPLISSVKENQVPSLTNKRVNLILKEFEEIVIKECRKYLSKSEHSVGSTVKPEREIAFIKRPEPRRVLVPQKCDKAVETTLSLEDPEIDAGDDDVSFSSISTVKSFSQVKDRLDRAAKLIQATYRGYKVRKILRDCQLVRSAYRPPSAAYSSDAFRVRLLDLQNNKKVCFHRGSGGSPRTSSASSDHFPPRRMRVSQLPLSPKPTSANLTEKHLGMYVPPTLPFYEGKDASNSQLTNLKFSMDGPCSAQKLRKVVNEPYPTEALRRLKETNFYQEKLSRLNNNNRSQQLVQPSVTDALLEKLRSLAEDEKRKARIKKEKHASKKLIVSQKENTYESDFESVSSITRHSPEAGENNVPSQDTSITDDYFGPSDFERRNSSTPIPQGSPVKTKPVHVQPVRQAKPKSNESSFQSTTVETDADLERNTNSKRRKIKSKKKEESFNSEDFMVSSVSTPSLDFENLPMPVLQLKLSAERERLSILDKALQVIIQNCPSQSSEKLDRTEIVKIAKAAVDEHIKRKLAEFDITSGDNGDIPPKEKPGREKNRSTISSIQAVKSHKINASNKEIKEDLVQPEIVSNTNRKENKENIAIKDKVLGDNKTDSKSKKPEDSMMPEILSVDKNKEFSDLRNDKISSVTKKPGELVQPEISLDAKRNAKDEILVIEGPVVTYDEINLETKKPEDSVLHEISSEKRLIDKTEGSSVFGDGKIDLEIKQPKDAAKSAITLDPNANEKRKKIVNQDQVLVFGNVTIDLETEYLEKPELTLDPNENSEKDNFVNDGHIYRDYKMDSEAKKQEEAVKSDNTVDLIRNASNENILYEDHIREDKVISETSKPEDSFVPEISTKNSSIDKTEDISVFGDDKIDSETEIPEDLMKSEIAQDSNENETKESVVTEDQVFEENTIDSETKKLDDSFIPEISLEDSSVDKTEVISVIEDDKIDSEAKAPEESVTEIIPEEISIDKKTEFSVVGDDGDKEGSEKPQDSVIPEIIQETSSIDTNEECSVIGDDKVISETSKSEYSVIPEIIPEDSSIDRNEECSEVEDDKMISETSKPEDSVIPEIIPEDSSIAKNDESILRENGNLDLEKPEDSAIPKIIPEESSMDKKDECSVVGEDKIHSEKPAGDNSETEIPEDLVKSEMTQDSNGDETKDSNVNEDQVFEEDTTDSETKNRKDSFIPEISPEGSSSEKSEECSVIADDKINSETEQLQYLVNPEISLDPNVNETKENGVDQASADDKRDSKMEHKKPEDSVTPEISPDNGSVDKNEEDSVCGDSAQIHQEDDNVTALEQKSANLSQFQLDSNEKGASSLIAVYLSALELREKPPPPYSPPSSESLSCSFRSFFINLEMETLKSTVKSYVEQIWDDWSSKKTIPEVKIDSVFCPSRPLNQSSSFDSASAAEWAHHSFDLLMTDILKDITHNILQGPTKNLVDFVRKGPIAIETQRLKAPKTQEELVSAVVNTSLKVIPRFILPNEDVPPSIPLKWTCRARDLVDDILVEEMIEDEPLWSDLWPEELLVKDELCNKIVEDCVRSVISDLKLVFAL